MSGYVHGMEVRTVGREALMIECGDDEGVRAAYAEALRRREAGELDCVDIVPGATTVLLDGVRGCDRLAAAISTWSPQPPEDEEARLVEVPVRYDGPDLEAVAELWGVEAEEVATRHRSTAYTVAFCGFAPGFAYLSGLPESLAVPRLEEPRTTVPAGSVGLAASYTGVYPRASPGGWQLIGRTDLELWDASRDQPALLSPGTRVRFVDA